MIRIFLAFILLFPVSAAAQDKSALCQMLSKHKPAADVIHKGGADLNDRSALGTQATKIPLNIDLAQRFASLGGLGLDVEKPLGLIDIRSDGSVFYNDEDWTQQSRVLCGMSHGIKETVMVEGEAAPGHKVNHEPEPIINGTQILNKAPIVNRVPAGNRAGDVVAKENEKTASLEVVKPRAEISEAIGPVSGDVMSDGMIQVAPAKAVPPKDVVEKDVVKKDAAEKIVETIDAKQEPQALPTTNLPTTNVVTKAVKTRIPDTIEGGEHREMFYNE